MKKTFTLFTAIQLLWLPLLAQNGPSGFKPKIFRYSIILSSNSMLGLIKKI
ncbi:hypothetical protein ACTJKN_03885 [Pedobacter sp. 22163]|uniref:hypothetical protein n=1 Tax=Pedobacter sp. 22163 TaxID=3453883 RepID=UPI003F841A9D